MPDGVVHSQGQTAAVLRYQMQERSGTGAAESAGEERWQWQWQGERMSTRADEYKGEQLRDDLTLAMRGYQCSDRDPNDHDQYIPWLLLEISGQLADINETLKRLVNKGTGI